ncbi:hypothetical protein MAR_003962, partial [Mya arenaria]
RIILLHVFQSFTRLPGTMPSCVPANNNNVGDVDAVKGPPQSDSKISKLITCLFFRKKTGVVDLAKESSAAARKKQRMTVDRSERSRRVLKMESMRTAPKPRDDDDAGRPSSGQGPTQMFLPSENPTG